MTKKDFLRHELLRILELAIRDQGFILNKSTHWFTQRTESGWNRFQLIFLNRESHWEIVPEISVRRDQVEDIYHQISHFERKYQKNTSTVGLKIEEYLVSEGQQSRFDL